MEPSSVQSSCHVPSPPELPSALSSNPVLNPSIAKILLRYPRCSLDPFPPPFHLCFLYIVILHVGTWSLHVAIAAAPVVSSSNFIPPQRRVTSSPGSMYDQSRRQSISDELANCEARLKVLQQMKAEVTSSSSRVSSASPRGLSHSSV